jgi:hypothetical protein
MGGDGDVYYESVVQVALREKVLITPGARHLVAGLLGLVMVSACTAGRSPSTASRVAPPCRRLQSDLTVGTNTGVRPIRLAPRQRLRIYFQAGTTYAWTTPESADERIVMVASAWNCPNGDGIAQIRAAGIGSTTVQADLNSLSTAQPAPPSYRWRVRVIVR